MRFTEHQQQVLQKFSDSRLDGFQVPPVLHYEAWTNWISWAVKSPELWVTESKDPELNERIKLQPTACEILEQAVADTNNKKSGYGIINTPEPSEYGILCLDFVNAQIFNSQGYSSPATIYYTSHSTAREEQLNILRLLAKMGAISHARIDLFYGNESVFAQTVKEIHSISKVEPVKINKYQFQFTHSIEILSDSDDRKAILLDGETLAKVITSLTTNPDNELLSSFQAFIKQGPNGLFSVTKCLEPSDEKEEAERRRLLAEFFNKNNWNI